MAFTDAPFMKAAVSFSDELFESGRLADVKIQCGEVCFHAHKLILCAQSQWFHSALINDFSEARAGVIIINIFKAEEISVLLKFLYTGSVQINSKFCDKAENPYIHQMRLYHLAEHFQVPKLYEVVIHAREEHTLDLSRRLCCLNTTDGQVESAVEQVVNTIEELYGKYHSQGEYPTNGVRFAFKFSLWRVAMCNVH